MLKLPRPGKALCRLHSCSSYWASRWGCWRPCWWCSPRADPPAMWRRAQWSRVQYVQGLNVTNLSKSLMCSTCQELNVVNLSRAQCGQVVKGSMWPSCQELNVAKSSRAQCGQVNKSSMWPRRQELNVAKAPRAQCCQAVKSSMWPSCQELNVAKPSRAQCGQAVKIQCGQGHNVDLRYVFKGTATVWSRVQCCQGHNVDKRYVFKGTATVWSRAYVSAILSGSALVSKQAQQHQILNLWR